MNLYNPGDGLVTGVIEMHHLDGTPELSLEKMFLTTRKSDHVLATSQKG